MSGGRPNTGLPPWDGAKTSPLDRYSVTLRATLLIGGDGGVRENVEQYWDFDALDHQVATTIAMGLVNTYWTLAVARNPTMTGFAQWYMQLHRSHELIAEVKDQVNQW